MFVLVYIVDFTIPWAYTKCVLPRFANGCPIIELTTHVKNYDCEKNIIWRLYHYSNVEKYNATIDTTPHIPHNKIQQNTSQIDSDVQGTILDPLNISPHQLIQPNPPINGPPQMGPPQMGPPQQSIGRDTHMRQLPQTNLFHQETQLYGNQII